MDNIVIEQGMLQDDVMYQVTMEGITVDPTDGMTLKKTVGRQKMSLNFGDSRASIEAAIKTTRRDRKIFDVSGYEYTDFGLVMAYDKSDKLQAIEILRADKTYNEKQAKAAGKWAGLGATIAAVIAAVATPIGLGTAFIVGFFGQWIANIATTLAVYNVRDENTAKLAGFVMSLQKTQLDVVYKKMIEAYPDTVYVNRTLVSKKAGLILISDGARNRVIFCNKEFFDVADLSEVDAAN